MDRPDQWHELYRMPRALHERIGVHTDFLTEADQRHWVLKSDSKHL